MSEHGGLGHNGGPSLEDIRVQWANAAHSIFGPSSSSMYLTCVGSLIPHLLAPDECSYAAAEGTIAHMVADIWLRLGRDFADVLVGTSHVQDGYTIEVTELMLGHLQSYVDWCQNEAGDHYFETKIDISPLTPIPQQFGTADFYALRWQHMTIKDLKYGEGIKVYAAEDRSDSRGVIDGALNGNPQAMLYAAGVFLEWDWFYNFQTITIQIAQPRLDHFDTWETTREDLLAFMEWAKLRMVEAWKPNQPRTPSTKGCQWCRVERHCPALLAWSAEHISSRFQDLDAVEADSYTHEQMASVMEMISDPTVLLLEPVDPQFLTIPQLANILRYRRGIEGWFRKIEQKIKDILDEDNDIEVPFWKMVQGTGAHRIFTDKFKAEETLMELGLPRDVIYKEVMLSPAQAEEQLVALLKRPKKEIAGLLEGIVVKPPGPRTLAPSSDRRLPLEPDGDRFENLDAVENPE